MLHQTTSGKGRRSIIFVHGNSQSQHTWDRVVDVPILRDKYALTTVDLPGHGASFRSNEPSKDYSLKGLAQHLVAFLSNWKAGGYLLVATSLGTNVVAESIPFLMDCLGVFLLCPCISGEAFTAADVLQPNPNLGASFLAHPTGEQLDAALNDLTYERDSNIIAENKKWFMDTDPAFREAVSQSVANQDWTDEIQNLKDAGIPVAVVSGAADQLTFPAYLANSSLPKWRNEVILVPQAGHCLQMEKPGLVAGLIGDFASDCFK
ncbi:MAG: alpha/beta hydrolase [Chitinophagaceae bacterium]